MAAADVATGERGVLAPADLARLLSGNDGEPAWQWFGGHAFAVLGDLEPLRELFEVEGCTVIRTQRDDDGVFRLTMRQVTLYRDPTTRAILARWRNPYSGAETAVRHQHLPAVQTTLSRDTAVPWLSTGERLAVFLDSHAADHFPLRPAPAAGIGRATSCAELSLQRGSHDVPGYVGAWQLLSDWPECLGMDEKPGYLFQRCFVRKLAGRHQLPSRLVVEAERRFPASLRSPPDASFGSFDTSDKVFQRERRPVPAGSR